MAHTAVTLLHQHCYTSHSVS